ncbi:contact-dependent growth inhibition system immunity protein [Streptomyces sp. NPDC051907]|uniref:contact-dependent growth inhibition system immunity protein n=1 Tax=Streptomyces sp. NPDC051907 TaxID=3155284 RepID=UPI0034218818
MSESTSPWTPSSALTALLYTDFDGEPADPDDVIADALDGGYTERTDGLRGILQDAAADPVERFLACCALATWADPVGYQAVLEACAAGERAVWLGASYDRFHGVDDTFGQLAHCVGGSSEMAAERGTADERLRAAKALLNLVDQHQFGRSLQWLLSDEIVAVHTKGIAAVAERGMDRIASAETIGFDLGLQIAMLIVSLGDADESTGTSMARRLIAAQPGERALVELTDLVARGSGEQSLSLAAELTAAANTQRMEQALSEARDRRLDRERLRERFPHVHHLLRGYFHLSFVAGSLSHAEAVDSYLTLTPKEELRKTAEELSSLVTEMDSRTRLARAVRSLGLSAATPRGVSLSQWLTDVAAIIRQHQKI